MIKSDMPKTALLLGWGGVIPFLAAALGWLYGDPVIRINALNLGTIYGGVIITFLGAVHWGLATERNEGTLHYHLVGAASPRRGAGADNITDTPARVYSGRPAYLLGRRFLCRIQRTIAGMVYDIAARADGHSCGLHADPDAILAIPHHHPVPQRNKDNTRHGGNAPFIAFKQ